MFKKLGAIVLTILYLVTAVGFVLNLRYCGKLITAVKIDVPTKNCGNSLMNGKMKCCSEKHFNIKIKDSHQGEFPSFLGRLFSFHVGKMPFANIAFNVPVAAGEKIPGRAPPDLLLNNTPVFIKNCTFRI